MAQIDKEKRVFDAIESGAPLEEIKLLINLPGVRIDFSDKHTMTPLLYAAYKGNIDLLKLLISYGSNVNYTGHLDGYTPLMFAALSGKEDAVLLILDKDANTSYKNKLGRTASQMASFIGYHNIAKLISNYITKTNIERTAQQVLNDLRDRSDVNDKNVRMPFQLSHVIQNYINLTNQSLIKLSKFLYTHPNLFQNYILANKIFEKLGNLGDDQAREDEILSFRCHYARHLLTYLVKPFTKEPTKIFYSSLKELETLADHFIKRLVKSRYYNSKTSEYDFGEKYLRQMIKEYPHKGDSIFKNLLLQLNSPNLGSISAVDLLQATFGGGQSVVGPSDDGVNTCHICQEKRNLKVCLRCHVVYYCDQYCQKIDWPYHKEPCAAIAANESYTQS